MPKRSRLKRGSGKPRATRMRSVNTSMIGDGKTPNKYWVSVSSDYYIQDPKEGSLDWASDVKGIDAKGKTLKRFDTYEQARAYANTIELESKIQGIEVNTVQIEDRLTGQVAERSIGGHAYEDIKFTIEREKELGVPSTMRDTTAKDVTVSNLVDYVMEYEGGTISPENMVRMFSYLIKTGQAWSLQGSLYGRPARDLIEAGVINRDGKINWDKVDEYFG